MSGDSCPNHVWTTTAATQSDDVDASLVDPCGNVCVDANGNPTGVDPCGLACTDACGNLCVDACLVPYCTHFNEPVPSVISLVSTSLQHTHTHTCNTYHFLPT